MFANIVRGALIAASLLSLLAPVNAGLDEIHVVTKLTGKVWIRQAKLKYGTPGPKWYKNPRFEAWRPLRKNEVIDPVCEVRTEPGATVWLQMGDQIENPAAFPRDSYICYYVVESNSTVRCNSQYDAKHPALVQTIHGKMHVVKTYGKAPVPKH